MENVRTRFVKVNPQRKPFVFKINMNIFQWRDNSVKPAKYQYTFCETIQPYEKAFPWPEENDK